MNTEMPQPGARIDEEEVCKDCFVDHLKRVCGCIDVTATPEKNDPPDYWARISGKLFAVEVTSIVNDQAYMASCKRFAQDIEAHARQNDMLKGFYALAFEREPAIPRRRSNDWEYLVASAMVYLRQTATLPQADAIILANDREGKISCKKFAPVPDRVDWGTWLPTPKFQDETESELSVLLQKAVTGKRERIEKKRVPEICGDAILLFYDAYSFGAVQDVKAAFRSVKGFDWFHSVFWVYPVWRSPETQTAAPLPLSSWREGCFLHTRETAWLR